ncbi:MAG: S8 family serine peptidase [Chitinophagaceae bacterium]
MSYLIRLFLLLPFVFGFLNCDAQSYAFRVKFKDKNGTLSFADSSIILTPKSLARRAKQGILLDSTDLPVVQSYIDTVLQTAAAVKLHNVSKWFNQIVVITYDSTKATQIAQLPMVENVKFVARYAPGVFKIPAEIHDYKLESKPIASAEKKTRGTSAYYGLSFQQMDIIDIDCLHDLGFKGEGMDIAVMDVNFRYVNTCPQFDSLILENRIKDTKDYVKDTNYVFSVAINNDHGMNSLSCMAANSPASYVGSAIKANYFLYITEDVATEQPIEEDNWVSAAERADSLGVDLINTSLGYNLYSAPHTSYSYMDLNGQTSLIVKGTRYASAKGIFVVVAQGNEGANPWHYMLTPADGDSVYSVGSVDGSGAWGQSSYGPTYDGRIKPDGCCIGKGVEIIFGYNGSCAPGATNGSSFAAPTMCGAIACLWQAFPHLTASQLKKAIIKSSSLYNSPNNTLGYGIPNFCTAYNTILPTNNILYHTNQFLIYPNPTQYHFNISNLGNSKYTYKIYDIVGRLVYQHPTLILGESVCTALEHQSSGDYIILLSSGDKSFSTKITKH